MQQLSAPAALALAATNPADAPPVVFLDVREPWEIATAAISASGARVVCMPMREVPSRLVELDPAQPVVCICHHGARSAQVVAFLERAGFASVYNLAGGIDAWSQDVDPSVARY
jgi:rhodanese-related sulfurtransferase